MKEIKFRAYHKTLGMLHVLSIDFLNELVECSNGEEVFLFTMNEVELLQYTGLKDKNGVEIYEGGIVINSVQDCKNAIVVFDKGSFILRCCDGEIIHHHLWTMNKSLEIIGNIYENPELLRKQHEQSNPTR